MLNRTEQAGFERGGVTLITNVLQAEQLMALREAVDGMIQRRPGRRALGLPEPSAQIPDIRAMMTAIATGLAGRSARLVRILAFDKTPDSNWAVPWHQDRTIAVRRRLDCPGFGPWTEKAGVPHVEPPEHLLKGMFSLRLHLDDCGVDNGPLKVIAGSHKLSRLPADEVATLAQHGEVLICTAQAGDVLAMKALVVHASNRARMPSHRRVLHLDFAVHDLPLPLEWAVDSSSDLSHDV